MRIVGVDPSLTGTGVAIVTGSLVDCDVIRPTPLPKKRAPKTLYEQEERVREIYDGVKLWVDHADVVVMEGPAFSRVGGLQEERYWLRGLIIHRARRNGSEFVIVTPTTLKLYATGYGASEKEAMLAAAHTHFPHVEIEDDNAADALWLAALVARKLGLTVDNVPVAHEKALVNITWPDFSQAA